MNMPDFSIAAIAYIRHVLLSLRLSPSGLAKRAKISSTTLTRALNDPKHKFVLSTKTLEKIFSATGVNPAPFLEAVDSADLSVAPVYRRTKRAKNSRKNVIADWENSGELPVTVVVGKAAANVWRDLSRVEVQHYRAISLRHSFIDHELCFCIEVGDESSSYVADKGDLLYCVRFEAWGGTAQRVLTTLVSDKSNLARIPPVIVEQRSRDGSKVNLTVRKLKRNAGHWELSFSSKNKRFNETIKLSSFAPTPELRLLGLVQYIIRGEGRGEPFPWPTIDR